MKKWGLLIATLLAAPASAQVSAPFCHVANTGYASCFYYSLDACRQAVSSMGGMCSANTPQPQYQQPVQAQTQPTPIQSPDIYGAYQRAYESGQRQRQAREMHEAQVRLVEAQTQAIQAQPQQAYSFPSLPPTPEPASEPEYHRAMYQCGAIQTPHPAPGCVVISVSD